MPTGDPKCPYDVKRAKQLNYLIKDIVDVGDGEDNLGSNQFIKREVDHVANGENNGYGIIKIDPSGDTSGPSCAPPLTTTNLLKWFCPILC